ncbi:hypothetical protein GGU45_002629 [Niabella hirudinis]
MSSIIRTPLTTYIRFMTSCSATGPGSFLVASEGITGSLFSSSESCIDAR